MVRFRFAYVIPPAFPEVGQPMAEGDFEDLEHNTGDPADLDVSDDHHLEPPSEQMRLHFRHEEYDEVDIEDGVVNVEELRFGVLRSEDPAI